MPVGFQRENGLFVNLSYRESYKIISSLHVLALPTAPNVRRGKAILVHLLRRLLQHFSEAFHNETTLQVLRRDVARMFCFVNGVFAKRYI